jgi:hypothetical protein
MNAMKKAIKSLAILASMALGGICWSANAGDIWEIWPCDANGTTLRGKDAALGYPTDKSDCLKAGKDCYFKIRLVTANTNDLGDENAYWEVVYDQDSYGASQEMMAAMYPLQIGIFVGGQLRNASLVGSITRVGQEWAPCLTDLIFKYTTRPGDVAFPILLATSEGLPTRDSDLSRSLWVNPMNQCYWKVTNKNGQKADFSFSAVDGLTNIPTPDSSSRNMDYTLKNCGFYVQTIDFDPQWEVEPTASDAGIWRSVHAGSTVTRALTPKFVADSPSSNAVSVFVWSMNEDIVRVKGGKPTTMWVPTADGKNKVEKTLLVKEVEFYAGQTAAAFEIEGVVETNETALLVMSAWPSNSVNKATKMVEDDYITVPVRTIEALPPTIDVSAKAMDGTRVVYPTGDYDKAVGELTITMTQPYTESDLKIQIVPKFKNGATADWGDYLRFGETADYEGTIPDKNDLIVTIGKGQKYADTKFYIYALRSDTNTWGKSSIEFDAVILEPADVSGVEISRSTIEVHSAAPLILNPKEGVKALSGPTGENLELNVEISDAYADMYDEETGYTVFVKYPGTGFQEIKERKYFLSDDRTLCSKGTDGTLRPLTLTFARSGENLEAGIKVKSPISGKTSEERFFLVDIEPGLSSTIETSDGKVNNVYREGETVNFKVTLSGDSQRQMFAFLKRFDETQDLGVFGNARCIVGSENSQGSGIAVGHRECTLSFVIKDGYLQSAGYLKSMFSVVFCSTPKYDEDNLISGYESNYVEIQSENVDPVIKYLEVNGNRDNGNGMPIDMKIPCGLATKFMAKVTDPGTFDLKDTMNPFETKWVIKRAGVGAQDLPDNGVIKGDPSNPTNFLAYTFTAPGEYTVTCMVKDKDMEDWSEDIYSITMTVLEDPSFEIGLPEGDTFVEGAAAQTISIKPTYWDPSFRGTLVARVEVAPGVASDNPGRLAFESAYFKGEGANGQDIYEISFTGDNAVLLSVAEIDGTLDSSINGFTIRVSMASNAYLPTPKKNADEYYISNTVKAFVQNMPPQCVVTPEGNSATSRWEVAGGSVQSKPINWTVRSDVALDFNGEWPDGNKGIKVSFIGDNNASNTFFLTKAGGGTYYPNFGTSQGDQDLTLMIEDKDGGMYSWTWYFKVSPSKFLTTVALGPSGGTSTSALSQKYARASGIGAGHTYVSGVTFSKAQNFRMSWNCAKNVKANIYGFGYKAGAIDNGSLNGSMDEAIDASGSSSGKVTDNYYKYDDERDSFFYSWLLHTAEGTKSLGVAPEIPNRIGTGVVDLPTETTGEGGYLEVVAEAVFSKEFKTGDNLGDINQDGIPDFFAFKEDWQNGCMLEKSEENGFLENEFKALTTFSVEGDRLPGVVNFTPEAGAVFRPEKASYGPVGQPFTALLKLRGFGGGLNEIGISDPDFSEQEQAAWEAYVTAWNAENTDNLLDVGAKDLTVWSPKPTGPMFTRMDPTVADTDGDGFTDGWEYYYWYKAHVEAWAAGDEWATTLNKVVGQRYVFERFNVQNILHGEPIDRTEVEARFNPCSGMNDATIGKNADLDGDGLSDLEEFYLGTNPCHWDSDGDHMSDGWEVLSSLDPLNGADCIGNADGDMMAYEIVNGAYYDVDGQMVVAVGDPQEAEGNKISFPGYVIELTEKIYGCEDDRENPHESNLRESIWGLKLARVSEPRRTWIIDENTTVKAFTEDYLLLHDQVRLAHGFDPRVAWNPEPMLGRWGKMVFPNTREYANYDEYLLWQYRLAMGQFTGDLEGETVNVWNLIRGTGATPGNMTNPSVPYPQGDVEKETVETVVDENGETNTVTVITTETGVVSNNTTAIAVATAEAFRKAGSSKTPYQTHGADTDGDGVPDGWELYVGRSPTTAPGEEEDSPLNPGNRDMDDDKLLLAQEFAGTDSCNAYKTCPSIYQNHPGNKSGWYNKFFPTNPGFPGQEKEGSDTDGDGIPDGDEGSSWEGHFFNAGKAYRVDLTFIYGSPEDDGSSCIRGGGMNPCAVDTDFDGLPDGWEAQHAGCPVDLATKMPLLAKVDIAEETFIADGLFEDVSAEGVYLAGGMDATWGGDADGSGLLVDDERTGTQRDLDFDHDGLQNYQEYLVQGVRHFRWDDVSTPLMGRVITIAGTHTQKWYGPVPMNAFSVGWFIRDAKDAWEQNDDGMKLIKARAQANGYGGRSKPWTMDGWRALGYFANPVNKWDPAYTYDESPMSLFMFPICGKMFMENGGYGYATSDPRSADTDGDGLDDFYEMFHGLNPILGSTVPGVADLSLETPDRSDLISGIYGLGTLPSGFFNAFWNEWTHSDYSTALAANGEIPTQVDRKPMTGPEALDPVLYPWTMGCGSVDADGDGLRNEEERLLANVTDPQPTHTDPSPAWFTDSSSPMSFVSQYYNVASVHPWIETKKVSLESLKMFKRAARFGARFGLYNYTFEENEGYDTDGDYVPDGREIVRTVSSATDPLRFDDPDRRQALYLDGVNSYAITKDRPYRSMGAEDLLKQFTVECWVNPEATGKRQTIIERATWYSPNAVNRDNGAIRANFSLGLDVDGRIFGLMDNADSKESGLNQPESCQRVDGAILPLGKWSHVALTYDGKALKIYVNGALYGNEATTLIPANGVTSIEQNVVDPTQSIQSGYQMEPCALILGARPKVQKAEALSAYLIDEKGNHLESFENYRDYFQGYIDEVRVWDGARTSAEIAADMKKRYTLDDVARNRTTVYQAWNAGASRNTNDGSAVLPAEIIHHYNFMTLPGAVKAEDVAKIPVGFDRNVANAAGYDYTGDQVDLEGHYDPRDLKGGENAYGVYNDLKISWWDECLVRSTVYSDTRFVNWIHDTVQHLPSLDGSTPDSSIYGEYYAGLYTPVAKSEFDKFVFPNSATPYAYWHYEVDRLQRLTAYEQLVSSGAGEFAEELDSRYKYQVRSQFIGTTSLLPMGGAFAKTCPKLWDGEVADAWEYSGTDTDVDGLPDWWETYAAGVHGVNGDLNWDSLVTYRGGTQMTAAQAFQLDLALGLQPNGVIDSAYAAKADDDGDGMPDWWERLWGVDTHSAADAKADPDNDGLSNLQEYQLSMADDKGLGLQNGYLFLNPNKARTGYDQTVTDYFLVHDRNGRRMYYGEIVADHDFMEDGAEDENGTNRTLFDAYSDNDEDGWSAWSELRFQDFKRSNAPRFISHLVGATEMLDAPVPTINATLRYNGDQELGTNGAVIVEAYASDDMSKKAMARFSIVPGTSEERMLYLGTYDKRVVHGTLTPGHIVAGQNKIWIEALFIQPDDRFYWTNDGVSANGTFADLTAAIKAYGDKIVVSSMDAEWFQVEENSENNSALQLAVNDKTQRANLLFVGEKCGEIDCVTGNFWLDLTNLGDYQMKDVLVGLGWKPHHVVELHAPPA